MQGESELKKTCMKKNLCITCMGAWWQKMDLKCRQILNEETLNRNSAVFGSVILKFSSEIFLFTYVLYVNTY
jgi:hypothetical protein